MIINLRISSIYKFAIFLLLSSGMCGCTKTDTFLLPQNKSQQQSTAKFFNVPANASPAVKRIAAEMEHRNNIKEFISSFAKINGYPIWDKAIQFNKQANNLPQNFNGLSQGSDTIIVTIPLVLENTNYVNAYIQASMVDTTITSLYYNVAAAYKLMSTSGSSIEQIPANRYALKYMLLNKEVFGYNKFKITDTALFKVANQAEVYLTLIQ